MDIASLLAPVSADSPSGADMSFSAEFDAIQEMRREDDPTLEQGVWVAELKTADWVGVARECESLLAGRSKDLRLAGWLADAWAQLRGFEGLAEGLALATGLLDAFWDSLHPLPDGSDQEERIGNLRWLVVRVEQLAPLLPLVVRSGRVTTAAEVASARALRLASKDSGGTQPAAAGGDESAPTLDKILRDATAAGRDAAAARRAHVTQARTSLAALQAAADARLGADSPTFVGARRALDAVLDEVGRLERDCGFSSAPAGVDADPAEAGSAADAGEPTAVPAGGPRVVARITSRAQALEQLRLVAAYFRATEPHSPAAYLADKAVRWAEMPLHEWLRNVVKDGGSLAHLEELLGIERPAESE